MMLCGGNIIVFGVILKYKKMTERLRLFADAVAIFFFSFSGFDIFSMLLPANAVWSNNLPWIVLEICDFVPFDGRSHDDNSK